MTHYEVPLMHLQKEADQDRQQASSKTALKGHRTEQKVKMTVKKSILVLAVTVEQASNLCMCLFIIFSVLAASSNNYSKRTQMERYHAIWAASLKPLPESN